MCTVTVLRGPWADAGEGDVRSDGALPLWRVVCNRDERRLRSTALPPALGRVGAQRVISPIDPQGPGTWIAATSAGLVFTLLNRQMAEGPSADEGSPLVSRGRVIPLLAGACDLEDVQRRIGGLGPLHTQPFTLFVANDAGALECLSDGERITVRRLAAATRELRTSSSVDEDAVVAWRTHLFDTVVTGTSVWAQRVFHRTPDPKHPHRGVLMRRPDACTVSITQIDVFGAFLRVSYEPIPADRPAVILEVTRQR